MPYKLRNNRRHKFKKARYKINNWPEYNEALKKRGSVTFWLSDEILNHGMPTKARIKIVAGNINILTLLFKLL